MYLYINLIAITTLTCKNHLLLDMSTCGEVIIDNYKKLLSAQRVIV